MRLGFLFVALLLVCGTVTACNTGLYGAAAGGSPPPPATTVTTTPVHQYGGPTNLLPNGSFTGGTTPWVSNAAAKLFLTSRLHRIGSTALLVRPATPGSYFSPKAVIASAPAKGQRYSFEAWAHGSPDLVGAPLLLELDAVVMTGPTTGRLVTVTQEYRPLGRHWRHFSVRGVVPVAGAASIVAIVGVQSVSKHSWLALDGAAAKLLPPVAKSTGTRRSSS